MDSEKKLCNLLYAVFIQEMDVCLWYSLKS